MGPRKALQSKLTFSNWVLANHNVFLVREIMMHIVDTQVDSRYINHDYEKGCPAIWVCLDHYTMSSPHIIRSHNFEFTTPGRHCMSLQDALECVLIKYYA